MPESSKKPTPKHFKVEIQETLSRTITVQANTTSEAVLAVQQQYDDGEHVLGADDFLDVDFIVNPDEFKEIAVPEVEELKNNIQY